MAKMQKNKPLVNMTKEELIDLQKETAKAAEEAEKKVVDLERKSTESAAEVSLAKKEAEAAKFQLEKHLEESKARELIQKEVQEVTKQQMKYFDKTFDAFIPETVTVVQDGKEVEVGFIPGIWKVRIPGFNTKYAIIKDKSTGEVKERKPFMDPQRGIYLDMLLKYRPDLIQDLFDKKVNIFKDLKTGEAIFGIEKQESQDFEVEE